MRCKITLGIWKEDRKILLKFFETHDTYTCFCLEKCPQQRKTTQRKTSWEGMDKKSPQKKVLRENYDSNEKAHVFKTINANIFLLLSLVELCRLTYF